MATCYGLDGSGFKSRLGQDMLYSTPVQIGLETHSAFCDMGIAAFSGVKRPEHNVGQRPPPSADGKHKHFPIFPHGNLQETFIFRVQLYRNVFHTLGNATNVTTTREW